MKKICRKLMSLLLAVVLVIGCFPVMSTTAYALQPVEYIERSWNGSEVVTTIKECTDYEVTPSTNSVVLTEGWWYAWGGYSYTERCSIQGEVHLIFYDNAYLEFKDGIEVPAGSTLHLHPQPGETGTFEAYADTNDNAAIGSNNESGDCGTIIIHGGNVIADGYNEDKGTDGAGIGGGDGCNGGNVIIYGGNVEAIGGDFAAGIGGGDADGTGGNGGNIKIYGGTVTAIGGTDAAGIGGGEGGNGGNIEIYGGTVTAIGGKYGAGIGGGDADGTGGSGGNIKISGGTVTATGGEDAAGIGNGADNDGIQTNITLTYNKDSYGISVRASSYNNNKGYNTAVVTLEKPFRDKASGTVYDAGEYRDGQTGALNDQTLVPADVVKITFDANGGTGTQADKHLAAGSTYTLPAETTFTAPEGKCAIESWDVTIGSSDTVNKAPGETITVTADTVLKAIWNEHDWNEWIRTKEPTCVETGSEYRVCARITDHKETRDVAIDRNAHDLNEAQYTWSKDNTMTFAVATCKRKDTHLAMELSKAESKVTKQPTCTEKGETTYTTTFKNQGFKTQTKTVQNIDIDENNHDWGAAEYTWSEDNKTVTAKRVCKNDSSHVETETVGTTNEIVKEATCSTTGSVTYTSNAFGNKAFEVQTKTGVELPVDPDAHEWDDGEEIEAQDICGGKGIQNTCKLCGETKIESLGGHEWEDEMTVMVEPTCEEAGDKSYKCKNCTAFDLESIEVIDPLGHSWDEGVVSKKATCTEEGVKTFTCTRDSSHIRTEAIEKISHTPGETVRENEIAATCLEDGKYDEVKYCTACKAETSRETKTVKALGHAWGFDGFTWTGDSENGYTSVVGNYKCKNDASHTETLSAKLDVTRVEPSCTKAGSATYTATISKDDSKDGVEHTESKKTTLKELAHTPGDAVKENEVAATCTTDGSYDEVTKCTECNKQLSSKHVVVPATGHKWNDWKIVKEATETVNGEEERTCQNDETHKETRVIPNKNHVHGLTRIAAKDSTCTETGNKEHWICDQGENPCGRYFADDAGETEMTADDLVVAMTDHTPGEVEIKDKIEPTCTNAGEHDEYTYCTVCKKELTHEHKVDPAIDHKWGVPSYEWEQVEENWKATATRVCAKDASHIETETVYAKSEITKEATCEARGETTYTATFADAGFAEQTKTVEDIDKLGHDWSEWVVSKEATETEEGLKGRVCNHDSSHVETLEIPRIGHEHKWEDPVYKWEQVEENWKATATRVCANDASHIETETVYAKSEITKEATCEEKGETTYTATFENVAFDKQTKTVKDIDALGHDWSEWVVSKEATETEEGLKGRVCNHDSSHVETEVIPKLDPSDDPTDPVDPKPSDDPTDPVDPQPSDPTDPVDPKPGDDPQPSDDPTDPVDPKPGDDPQPSDPTDPVDPTPSGDLLYRNTEGDGTQWTKDSNITADFTFKRTVDDEVTFSHFTGIQVDGKDVDESDYIAEPGSVIIKLRSSYLETLAVGEHTLTAMFNDGNNPSAKFTIVAKRPSAEEPASDDKAKDDEGKADEGSSKPGSNSSASGDTSKNATGSKDSTGVPRTGDNEDMLLMFALLCTAMVTLAGMATARRRK